MVIEGTIVSNSCTSGAAVAACEFEWEVTMHLLCTMSLDLETQLSVRSERLKRLSRMVFSRPAWQEVKPPVPIAARDGRNRSNE